ncbi:alpha-amylase family glycosyl hydrolase [Aureisphaera galaxeae]|uniref:alpha-amylase family glycosyl hydrolase n=1 Tax=Aureisphaera galaxeae TaxID=1538023 RepID=UPI002350C816|nr:alpha-amylase family glycosyl hydrolase [Aureisphaera galaxeae]MDC8004762.1 alpha-amylase family glycosyl hydrolase [Aureisphaera galaxeae]
MSVRSYLLMAMALFIWMGCGEKKKTEETPNEETTAEAKTAYFDWEGANVYFLLTDRFNNGDPSNDVNFDRTNETAVLRGFEGGDIKGVTQKIREGYFNDLGVNAIWMTPIVEQIHDGVDEGTGYTYGYHGYWTKDWTTLDPNFGTKEDLQELVTTAHENGIRILLDAVINHHGPQTETDGVWPEEWVRTSPKCDFQSYETTTKCTLVANLPDVLTESNEAVSLPPQLEKKWKEEGRYEEEMAELDAFFEKTGHPRAPRFYIMKWLADYITDYGIDGYRVDTVKHTEEYVWEEFEDVCDTAFAEWKANNPSLVLDDAPFYLVGEIYFYSINTGKYYDFGDKKVNYFNDSFDALINFDLRSTAEESLESVFSRYSNILNGDMDGYGTMSYISSHDDGGPYDKSREKTYESAVRLLLAPGASQIYYGDEIGRSLIIEGTQGDATLRSPMDWKMISNSSETQRLLKHWQKLGQFRNNHMSVGAGVHKMISEAPYVFSRTYTKGEYTDQVVVSLNNPGDKEISVGTVFANGTALKDAYSGQEVEVKDGKVTFSSEFDIVLLETLNP